MQSMIFKHISNFTHSNHTTIKSQSTKSKQIDLKSQFSPQNVHINIRILSCSPRIINNSHISAYITLKISEIQQSSQFQHRSELCEFEYTYISVLIYKSRRHIRLEPLTLSKRFVQAWILTFFAEYSLDGGVGIFVSLNRLRFNELRSSKSS